MSGDDGTITFRPLTRDDLRLFHAWLHRPHVAEWWGPQGSLEELAEEYAAELDGSATTRIYLALEDGEPVGYIQSYVAIGSGGGWWEGETDPGVRGVDQFLANAHQLNRGLGTRMVRAFLERLFEDPAVTRVQTDPSPENARAIRCYEKAGFRSSGTVDTPDGPALLMTADRASVAASRPPAPR